MIETAIQSVLVQNYPYIEHIIMDGGSTDGTLDVLKKYSHLRVVSAPDQGMYDALNKGLGLATGEIIGFLNTDDYYPPDIFAQIAHFFSNGTVDAVAGIAGIVSNSVADAQDVVLYHPGHAGDLVRHTVLEMPIFNAYFFSYQVFQKIGAFDVRYRIAADRDFMLRFALGNFNTTIVNFPTYCYVQHSGSMTFDYTEEKFRKIVDEHLLMTKAYIDSRSNYPKEMIESLIELRTRETIRVCAHCIRHTNLSEAWYYLTTGFRYNPLWLVRFAKHAVIHPIRQKVGLPYHLP